jgi:hypothetical protein
MHRNSYDNDNSTFSPQGRLHQVRCLALSACPPSLPSTDAALPPPLSGRVRPRGRQARIRLRRTQEQYPRHPPRSQGEPPHSVEGGAVSGDPKARRGDRFDEPTCEPCERLLRLFRGTVAPPVPRLGSSLRGQREVTSLSEPNETSPARGTSRRVRTLGQAS